jgi:hypothetical protein
MRKYLLGIFFTKAIIWSNIMFAQMAPQPREWGKFGNEPVWPPQNYLAPVPDEEVPIDSYQLLLFILGIVLAYALWQRKLGKSWRQIFTFSNVYSSLVSKT